MTRVKRDTTAARWAAVSSGGLNEGPLGRAFVLFSLWFAVAAVASVGQVDVFGEIAKVTAVDGSEKDVFGVAIALDGEQLFVGARQDIFGTGATYVYELDEDLGWTLATKLTAPDEATGNLFGEALSADGDRIAIGASMDAAPFPGQGSAYIFERSGGTWHPAAKLEVDGFGFQFFGISISLEGDRLAAGASNDNILGITSGSVYLFERSPSGAWEQVDKIFGSDTESGDQFGSALALDGDQFAVSAITDDDQGSNSGSVYIFERSADGDWLEVEKVTAPDGGDFDQFGNAVALDADRLMVGVTSDDEFGVNSGAVHVYHRNIDGSWDWVQKLTALDAQERSEFGTSLALDGDRLAVGSAAFLAADAPGAAYIFEPDGDGRWVQIERLAALDRAQDDRFGFSVALEGTRLAVGVRDDDDLGDQSGSTYIFQRVVVSPELVLSGVCPGEVTLQVLGVTPRDGIQLYGAAALGVTTLSTDRCEGVDLNLDSAQLLREDNSGFETSKTSTRQLREAWCGRYLQLLDERTCSSSPIVQIPSAR